MERRKMRLVWAMSGWLLLLNVCVYGGSSDGQIDVLDGKVVGVRLGERVVRSLPDEHEFVFVSERYGHEVVTNLCMPYKSLEKALLVSESLVNGENGSKSLVVIVLDGKHPEVTTGWKMVHVMLLKDARVERIKAPRAEIVSVFGVKRVGGIEAKAGVRVADLGEIELEIRQ